MSDSEKKSGYDADKTSKLGVGDTAMTDRLAALRASIRASKSKMGEASSTDDGGEEQETNVMSRDEISSVVDEEIVSAADEDSDGADNTEIAPPLESSTQVLKANAAEVPNDLLQTQTDLDADEVLAAEAAAREAAQAKEDGPARVELFGDDEAAPSAHAKRTAKMEGVDGPATTQTPAVSETDAATRSYYASDLANPAPGELTAKSPYEETSPWGGSQDDEESADDAANEGDAEEQAYPVGPTRVEKMPSAARSGVSGTPLYMSPEQIRGEVLDEATDVYSLGVMLFELLEGEPPFVADTIEEVLFKHQDAAVPQQFSEFTPPEIKNLVARMLDKNPRNRPGTAEVIDILQNFTTIGGPDVHGLEEESWKVDEVDENAAPVNPALQQLTGEHEPLPVDEEFGERKKGLPLVPIIAVVVVLLLGLGLVMALSGDDEPEEGAVAAVPAVEETSPAEEDAVEEEVVEEEVEEEIADAPEEPVEEVAAVEEAETAPDAGAGDDSFVFGDEGAGGEEAAADELAAASAELPPEEPAVEEEPPEPPPKKKRKRRKPKKKEPVLREIRLSP